MSNAERQRQFRQRNPGYYGRLHAKRRAGVRALSAARAAAATPARTEPLMLPAPVEMPLFSGLNAIPASLAAMRERVPLPVSHAPDQTFGTPQSEMPEPLHALRVL